MREISNAELSTFKILPFDVYNDLNQKVMNAGEILTPGKLIILKNFAKLYTEEYSNDKNDSKAENDEKVSPIEKLAKFSFDTLDAEDFETVINKNNLLPMETQIKVKYYYKRTQNLLVRGFYSEALAKLNSLVNIFITDILKPLNNSDKGSRVIFLGEYEICHALNVAIISGLIAKRMEYNNRDLEQILLAALLHDIGKFELNLADESALKSTNEEAVAKHTLIGYKLIKEVLHLPEEIAKVALEHHENNDGSGYPLGLSSDYISEYAQIINVANYYDNVAFNRTALNIINNRDVLRAMLDIGTKKFSARALYTFVHMFSYDDINAFSDMII